MFLAKMGAARFVAGEGVDAHELGEFEKISDAACAFEGLIECFALAWDAHVLPELFPQLRDAGERFAQTGFVPGHSTFVPKHQAQLTMERINGSLSVYGEKLCGPRSHLIFRRAKFDAFRRRPLSDLRREINRK